MKNLIYIILALTVILYSCNISESGNEGSEEKEEAKADHIQIEMDSIKRAKLISEELLNNPKSLIEESVYLFKLSGKAPFEFGSRKRLLIPLEGPKSPFTEITNRRITLHHFIKDVSRLDVSNLDDSLMLNFFTFKQTQSFRKLWEYLSNDHNEIVTFIQQCSKDKKSYIQRLEYRGKGIFHLITNDYVKYKEIIDCYQNELIESKISEEEGITILSGKVNGEMLDCNWKLLYADKIQESKNP